MCGGGGGFVRRWLSVGVGGSFAGSPFVVRMSRPFRSPWPCLGRVVWVRGGADRSSCVRACVRVFGGAADAKESGGGDESTRRRRCGVTLRTPHESLCAGDLFVSLSLSKLSDSLKKKKKRKKKGRLRDHRAKQISGDVAGCGVCPVTVSSVGRHHLLKMFRGARG
jgi:hypothetical protein